jgi:hypothetical protein
MNCGCAAIGLGLTMRGRRLIICSFVKPKKLFEKVSSVRLVVNARVCRNHETV